MCQRSKSQYMLVFFFNVVRYVFKNVFTIVLLFTTLHVEDVNLHEVNVTRIPSFFLRKGWQF